MGFFDLPIVGDVAKIAGGLIGAKYGSDLQGHENDRMREYNLNMAREMFDKQVAQNQYSVDQNRTHANLMWEKEKAYNQDLWNQQNEYNSPKAQMARMTDAGLNPNLFYSQGTSGVSAVVKSGSPGSPELDSASVPRVDYGSPVDRQGSIAGALDRYVSIRNADVQARNMDVQRKSIEAQTRATNAEAKMREHEYSLFKGSKFSRNDPPWLRVGGRLGRFLYGEETGSRSSFSEDNEGAGGKVKPVFHIDNLRPSKDVEKERHEQKRRNAAMYRKGRG